ncbi:hypothetical protein L226DRAFT_573723 [Lentinus tigrinus ALCF2SS1-7]|nr:hypothetical protein L226DRAFT_573723 [Lentinus tigrinus ALCF2SS1-7]
MSSSLSESSHRRPRVRHPSSGRLGHGRPRTSQDSDAGPTRPATHLSWRYGGARPHLSLRISPHLEFLQAVHEAYPNDPGKYDLFVACLRRHQACRGTIRSLMMEVGGLFVDCPHLVEGFNAFLPNGYTIKLIGNPSVLGRMQWHRSDSGFVLYIRDVD